MKRNKPIAVFDIDGTIFRSSLLIELNDELVRQGVFPLKAAKQINASWKAWTDRRGSYADYIGWIVKVYGRDVKGVRVDVVRRAARTVIAEHKGRVYVYTRELIRRLRPRHTLVIISFSPLEAVQEFNKHYRFDIISGARYASRRGVYTGQPIEAKDLSKKNILLQVVADNNLTLQGSIGVGDTESDIGFLSLVERPIAFNPNSTLYHHAKRRGWEIVVERKDVIYKQ